jgi:dTDP-4-dehydrorhamnose reductase
MRFIERVINLLSIVTADYPTKTQRPQNSYLSKDKITKAFNISPRKWEVALNEFMLTIETFVKHEI